MGFFTSLKQKDSKDYFLGGKEMKWWSVGFSIVASETSTLTFISIPVWHIKLICTSCSL